MPYLTPAFQALLKEAQFTKEMLGSGATQIRNANYATKGICFQAFTSLSTGLERIGKLCLMVDRYIETHGTFPDFNYLKNEIGHKLTSLYQESQAVVGKRSIALRFQCDLSDPIHQAILRVLHNFAEGDRYSNINLLVGSRRTGDPITLWFHEVDVAIYETRVTDRKKQTIARNASLAAEVLGSFASVLHTSEMGTEITDLEEASHRTGLFEAVAPFRQLYVLQVIRYWVELLYELEHLAHALPGADIPFFGEVFAIFYNDDSYFRTRKTWEKV